MTRSAICGFRVGVLRGHHDDLVGTQPIDQSLPRQRSTLPPAFDEQPPTLQIASVAR